MENYIRSAADLDPNAVYALPYETRRLRVQLDEIASKRGIVASHISDAMEQSSETWHDNAPADALFGEMFQLDTRESGLIKAARRLIEVPYPTPEVEFATLGSRVKYEIGGDAYLLDIVGNLPLDSDEDDHDEVDRGSISAPMPQAMLGATPGQSLEVVMPGRSLKIGVIAVDQSAQERAYDEAA